jgi:hypothetical protein
MRLFVIAVAAALSCAVFPATTLADQHHVQDAVPLPCTTTPAVSTRHASQPISEADTRGWLACYQDAWKRKDPATLSSLGVIRTDQREALRTALAAYQQLHVAVGNETISVNGAQAVVEFDRTDIDELGKLLVHPRQMVRLQHTSQGIVAVERKAVVR